MSDWEIVRLGDYCIKIGSGATPKGGQESYKDFGISLIRSQNVYNNYFDFGGIAYIDDLQAAKLSNVIVESNDILLNITGDSVARVCQVPDSALPARVNQHVSIVRPNPDFFDSQFVKYYLVSPYMQSHMLMLSSAGATRKALTKGMIEGFEIPLPPLEEQREIAHILGSLDDKIEANRRQNESLEATARALFKSWFVDFDPVHAKANGEQPLGMDAATADLFPDSFQESELGMIPSGWEVSVIGDLVKSVGGGTPSTKEPNYWDGGFIHFATPKDLSGLSSPVLLDTERKITEDGLQKISSGLLPEKTVLLSSRAPVGYLAIAEIPVAINQGFIAMICEQVPSYLYTLFWTQFNLDEIKQRASGTTFQEISKKNFRPIPAILPSESILNHFDEIIEPIYTQIVSNLKESRTLAETRDALLPQLVSGQLRVGDLD